MCMPYALSMQSLCICSASTSRSTVSSLHLATYHQDPFLKTVLVLFSPALGQSGSASRHVEESEVAGSRAHGCRPRQGTCCGILGAFGTLFVRQLTLAQLPH